MTNTKTQSPAGKQAGFIELAVLAVGAVVAVAAPVVVAVTAPIVVPLVAAVGAVL